MLKKHPIFFIFFLILIFPVQFFSLEKTTGEKGAGPDSQKNVEVDITIEPGIAGYTGNFGEHLYDEGAYFFTPTFDLYVGITMFKHYGIQAMLGSGCVIHPFSEPVEGTILYMAIETYYKYSWDFLYLKFFCGVGFEHTTMLIQLYASGFAEAGFTVGFKLVDRLYLTNSLKHRIGFLHSILLPQDRPLTSLTFSLGVSVLLY